MRTNDGTELTDEAARKALQALTGKLAKKELQPLPFSGFPNFDRAKTVSVGYVGNGRFGNGLREF